MLDLDFHSDSRRELTPARALLTPTWVAALALLVANDHWLKGAGLVPSVLTGKLSDFAGMIVAPVLLASVLRLRTRRALALCHVAVAVVFAGIQLAPGFAAQWSALMGLFGHPWAITCDPTDLIALPFLLLSWALLVPEMDPSEPALRPIQRTAVATLSVLGLWSTVATSDDSGIDPDGEWYVDVYGHVYINNANEFDIALFIRPLRTDLDVNCDEISLDPGRLLTDDAFGAAEHWELPPRTNVAIEFNSAVSDCGAAMIAGEGIPPTIVFIDRHQLAPQWFPGQTFSTSELGSTGMAVVFDEVGGEWVGGDMLRHTIKTDTPEQPGECQAPEDERRLDWAGAVPTREVELIEVNAGVDGCFELLVQEISIFNGEIQTHGTPYPFYLCAPEVTVPFAVGERIEFVASSNGGGHRELSATLLEFDTLHTATSDTGAPVRRVRYVRGSSAPAYLASEINRSASAVPGFDCPWMIEDGCATVERPTELLVEDAGYLEPGVPVALPYEVGGTLRTLTLGYARNRALVDPACSGGATLLDYDLDYVILEEPLI